MILLFDPATALAAVSAGSQVIGGIQEGKQTARNAKAEIADVRERVRVERISEARELRDLEADSEQNIALLKARAAAGGASLAGSDFRLRATRELKETEISKSRVREDSDANVTSLLRLSGNISKAAKDKAKSGLIGGLAGGGSSLLNIFG